jgi:hypothetical protein
MRIYIISGLMMLSLLTASAQETRVKGLLIPFVEHSIGVEQSISRKFSIQLLYINRVNPSITKYYYQRVIPSFRYYIFSNEKKRDFTFIEVFYRYAYTKQVSDQSPEKRFFSNSVGLDIGKQRLISDNAFIEGSIGYYFIYSGEDPKSPLGGLRIDIKFGVRIKYKNK